MVLLLRLAFVLVLIVGSSGYKLLAFLPYPAKSHHGVTRVLIQELARRGHNVTYVTPFPTEFKHPNYEEIHTTNFLPDILKIVDLKKFDTIWSWEGVMTLKKLVELSSDRIYSEPAVRELITSNREFDAVMDMSSVIQEPAATLYHRFKAVGIEIIPLGSSFWTQHLVGGPTNPSYMIDYSSHYTDRMSFMQRLHNTLVYVGVVALNTFVFLPMAQVKADQRIRYPGWENRPSLTELIANKSLVITNSHFSMNYAFPRAPQFIEVAGMNIVPNKPLPKDLQTFMDGATEGVIYLSLGSNVEVSKFLEGDLLGSFTGALGKLKQRVVWKWENQAFPGKPANVMTAKWLPQQDVLAHKNCKGFITQGGFMSLTEAVYHSVPMIGIPLFGDQRKNMVHAEEYGYGIRLELENVTAESISWAVDELLTNPNYRDAVKRRSEIFRDRPMSAVDEAIYWIEYVIRHRGAPHLKTAIASMPWYESILLDVAVFVTTVFVVTLFTVSTALKALFRFAFGKRTLCEKLKQKAS